jgi:hypothetical protein
MRHALGVLGVLAAGVLLAVSAAMNWRFGYSLGKTDLDGQILGAASAAADCLKALVPFYFFAAMRNRSWSQAGASALVWVVVTGYSLTSAMGHAALNRLDTSGQRAVAAASYQDLRADMKRAQEQLGWIPQHRPAQTVQSDVESLKTRRAWATTNGCTEVTGKSSREFCQQYHGLTAELASAGEADKLEARIAEVKSKLDHTPGTAAMAAADPQATVLSRLTGQEVGVVQTALTVLVAILLEIGSGFGMYVAFSQWKLYETEAPERPSMPASAASLVTASVHPERPHTANDNKTLPKLVAPEADVERFYKERVTTSNGSSITATTLYEDYCAWCEEQDKEPLALPTFGREFGEVGVQKAKIAGRVRYIGIALKSGPESEEVKKMPIPMDRAA